MNHVHALFVGGPADGTRLVLPGDEHGRPTSGRFRLPIGPGLVSYWEHTDISHLVPLAAVYEPDLAVTDGNHMWRFRYVGQS